MAAAASSFSFPCFFHAHATQPPSGATRCIYYFFENFNILLVSVHRSGHSHSLMRAVAVSAAGKNSRPETPEV